MDRRAVLAGAAALLAGCVGGPDGGDDVRFGGPTDEDPEAVDLRHRYWRRDEVRELKRAASTVPYEALRSDVDRYRGETLLFRSAVVDRVVTLDPDGIYALRLRLDPAGEQVLYGSWIGERVIRTDLIDAWGRVLGTETYEDDRGLRTVPAVSLVDLRVVGGA